MSLDLPPSLEAFLPATPAIVRPGESWQWDVDAKLKRLGVTRRVRRAVLAEMAKLVGQPRGVIRATLGDIARWGDDPRVATFPMPTFMPSVLGATLVFVDSTENTSNTTSYTYSAHAIGDAAADRVVLVVVHHRRAVVGTGDITGLTIAGSSATQIVGVNADITVDLALFGLLVTTGTTADIVVSVTPQGFHNAIGVCTLRGTGGSITAAATNTASGAGTDPLSAAVTVPAGGCVLAAVHDDTASSLTVTWTTPLGEEWDFRVETSHLFSGALANGQSGSVTCEADFSATPNDVGLIAAAW